MYKRGVVFAQYHTELSTRYTVSINQCSEVGRYAGLDPGFVFMKIYNQLFFHILTNKR